MNYSVDWDGPGEREHERELCSCIQCGREHWQLASPPWALSYDDWCRLSIAFNRIADTRDRRDYHINEWLKRGIANAKRPTYPERD